MNEMLKTVKRGYELGDYAGTYRTKSNPTNMEKEHLDKFASLLPKHGKILDLGCGIGIPFDKYLIEQGFEVTGIDIASKHIKLAKKNVPRATYIEGDFTTLDFNTSKFHGIVAFYSIFHTPKKEHAALFRRMALLLENKGVALLTLGTRTSDGVDDNWCGATMAWSSYDPETYKTLLHTNGFDIVADSYEGQPEDQEYHWWVMIKKRE